MRHCFIILLLFTLSCSAAPSLPETKPRLDTIVTPTQKNPTLPEKVVAFAKTLIGTPYKFGCTAPDIGFDCSGFITYVFNHFKIDVPRSSAGFANEGTPISLGNALPGDLILFSGTNRNVRTVGHIGLIVAHNTSGISFIHSSSGNENAVIITQMDERYMARFVKVIRILE